MSMFLWVYLVLGIQLENRKSVVENLDNKRKPETENIIPLPQHYLPLTHQKTDNKRRYLAFSWCWSAIIDSLFYCHCFFYLIINGSWISDLNV